MTTDPLRGRLPHYARWFAVEIGAAALISLPVWWIAGVAWPRAFAGSLIGIGVLSLLAGGAAGGGYYTAGSYGIFYGRHHDRGWGSTAGEIERARDLRARLRNQLRPGPNPTAFWQVVGGAALVAIGIGVLAIG